MKNLLKFLALGVVLAASAPLALADTLNQISFAGLNSYCTPTGAPGCPAGQVTFTSPTITGQGYGALAEFSFGTTGFDSFNYLATPTTPFELFHTTATDGAVLRFFVSSDSYTIAPDLVVLGSGFYTRTGTDGTVTTIPFGTFNISTQGTAGTIVSFSDSNMVTPEPSSLVLLGTGIVSAAGMLVRRRQITA